MKKEKEEKTYNTAIGLYCSKCDRKTGLFFNGTICFSAKCLICGTQMDLYKWGTLNPPIPISKLEEFCIKENWFITPTPVV